jgi:hypothetical protein
MKCSDPLLERDRGASVGGQANLVSLDIRNGAAGT